MKVIVNGEQIALLEGDSFVSLLTEYGYDLETRGIALALNGEVIPRGSWAETKLSNGDQVELVRAVQGG